MLKAEELGAEEEEKDRKEKNNIICYILIRAFFNIEFRS